MVILFVKYKILMKVTFDLHYNTAFSLTFFLINHYSLQASLSILSVFLQTSTASMR